MVDMTNNPRTTLSRPMGVETRRARAATSPPHSEQIAPNHPLVAGSPLSKGTVVSRAHDQMTKAAEDFGTALDDIHPERLMPDALAGAVDSASQEPCTAIDRAVKAVHGRAREADEAVNNAYAALAPSLDIAGELRAGRAWGRLKGTLDAAPNAQVVGVAHQLIREADTDELGVLSSELRSYLRAHNLPSDWLAGALAQAAPALRDAMERAHRAAKAQVLAESNSRALHRAMDEARRTGAFRAPRLVDPGPHDPDTA
jgi:hypothetical protein